MPRYTLERGLVLRIGNAQWEFQRQLDHQYVQLENQATGRIRKEKLSKLTHDITNGTVEVVRDSHVGIAGSQSSSEDRGIICTDSLPDQYKTAYLSAHEYVRAMRRRGITKGQRSKIATAIPIAAAIMRDKEPPSTSTVMRWMRTYDASSGNAGSLISGNLHRRRKPKIPKEIRRLVNKTLAKHYFVRNGCTQRAAHEQAIRALEQASLADDDGLDKSDLSLSTVRRLICEVTPFDRDLIRLGPTQARSKWRFSQYGRYATRPLERVEMDHTLLDIWVIDDERGIPLGRPTITILVCGYSGYITGFYISFEGECLARVVRSIKIAIQPKDMLTAAAGLTNEWHSMGLWETLVVDNALAFHSPHLKQIAIDLGSDLEYCPVRMPWFKPSAERHIGELCAELPKHGRPQKPGSREEPIDPRTTACITFSDLCVGILRWVVDVHPLEINERKLARPLDLFLDGLNSCPAPTFVDSYANLDILAGLSATATVDHGGLIRRWIQYASDDLKYLRHEIGTKFKANVKYDPNDLGSLFVQHPRKGTWITAFAKDQEYAAGLSETQHKQIRDAAKERLTLSNAERVLRKARLDLQDYWDSVFRRGTRIKRGAKDYALFQGFSSAAAPRIASDSRSAPPANLIIPNDEIIAPMRAVPTFETFSMERP
jgi:putative transposase